MNMLDKTMNIYLEEQFEKYADNKAIIYPEADVSLIAPSCPDWLMYYLALTKIGAIPVCLNDKNTQNELEYLLDHSDSYAAIILYTSGTTGRPKAVMSVHNRMLTNIKVFLDNFGYTQEDRILSALPLYHVMGCLFTAMLTFMAGGSLVLISKFKTKKALEIIGKSCFSQIKNVH